MPVYAVVVLAVVAGTALPVYLHSAAHGFNVHQTALAFFLWLNVIIALWELCLFFRIDRIEEEHRELAARYRGRELDRVKEFFGSIVPLSRVFSPSTWAQIWSTYSVFDDSYADRKSFGFFVDVGNGFSTLIPSLLVLYGVTYPWCSARVLGLVGFVILYQMWYGTVIYFFSFVFNKRYVGHTRGNLALFVGLSNGLWLTLPPWCMWACWKLIATDSYAVFTS